MRGDGEEKSKMENLVELASEILTRCPDCGDDAYFRVRTAELKIVGVFNKRGLLRVKYRCSPECMRRGGFHEYDIEEDTLKAHMINKKAYQKKMRDTFGL